MDFKKLKINLPEISPQSKKILEIVSVFIIVIFAMIFFTINQFPLTGKIIDTEGYRVVPLNPDQREKIEQSILVSEFVKDIPENDPVFLRFFSFENGERIWQDGFLIGNKGIMTQGEPTVYLSIHSKYLSELNGQDLCSIVNEATKNKDVGLHSDYNKARLFLKYSGMLKYRSCFGF